MANKSATNEWRQVERTLAIKSISKLRILYRYELYQKHWFKREQIPYILEFEAFKVKINEWKSLLLSSCLTLPPKIRTVKSQWYTNSTKKWISQTIRFKPIIIFPTDLIWLQAHRIPQTWKEKRKKQQHTNNVTALNLPL